jgi:hypothetical protein
MEHHHSARKDGSRRPEWEHWSGPVEWVVTPVPVRDADGRRGAEPDADGAPRPVAKSAAEPRARRGERIAELHRQVRDGVYDSIATIDVVARRILQSGDL